MNSAKNSKTKVAIIGGGASGFFAAIRIAETCPTAEVNIFEASSGFLKKVRISGGGRCNVTHNLFETKNFVQNYPRGSKELISPFSKFQALDTVKWFKERGVELVPEADGRMFPTTNRSETVINCFLKLSEQKGVNLHTGTNIQEIIKKNDSYTLKIRGHDEINADYVVVATGSSPTGYRFAKSLGHKITDLAPSLFSFKIAHSLLLDKSGLSFQNAEVSLKLPESKKKFQQKGPILITHWGLSGPAVLKLSAWAARECKLNKYKGLLSVNWLGLESLEKYHALIHDIKANNIKTFLKNVCPEGLTKSFWERLLSTLEINAETKYADLSSKQINKICSALFSSPFEIDGKNRYKDEFVECGGVHLKEINFKNMESKISSNLFFTGEVLDVDGITGGFNFQNAWTTGWLAGSEISERIKNPQA